MPLPKNVYTQCDELNNIPKPNKDNWLREIDLMTQELKPNAKVLQVGCMNGIRIMALLEKRPDLVITGLDLEKEILELAKENFEKFGIKANLVHGDITRPPELGYFDYVTCLNNTLGYIAEEKKAIKNMKKLEETVILSVYGEKFTDGLARAYFKSINLELTGIDHNIFHTKEFINVKRYIKEEVEGWGGKIIETPIGYFVVINRNI
jgi:methylase of polypeptide subunit release factors